MGDDDDEGVGVRATTNEETTKIKEIELPISTFLTKNGGRQLRGLVSTTISMVRRRPSPEFFTPQSERDG